MAAEPQKWALLVGIDKYKSADIPTLQGAVNDVLLMQEVLINKFMFPKTNIKVLRNEEATHERIVQEIRDHLGQAKTDDVVIFHFSGHGSQMQDISGDETVDNMDETLVAYDSRSANVFDVSDDEINGLLEELSQKTKNITFIFDSCHSGAAAKAANSVRGIKPDDRTPSKDPMHARSIRGADGALGMRLTGAQYVLISGSLDTELSHEGLFDGKRHGAMTWFLAQSLRSAPKRTTYRSIMDEVKAEVTSRYRSQHPQIEGPAQDRVVFGTDTIRTQPSLLVMPVSEKMVRIEGGTVYGLRAGAILRVFPFSTEDFDSTPPIAKIRIKNVNEFGAEAEIMDGGKISSQSRALIDSAYLGGGAVTVFMQSATSKQMGDIKKYLKQMPSISLVDTERDARIVVSQEQGKILVRGGDLELLLPPVELKDVGAARRVSDQVKDLAHWFIVLNLKNPLSTLDIDLDVRRSANSEGMPKPDQVSEGTELAIQIRNRSAVGVYVYLMDVSSDGSICMLFPANDDCTPSGANEKLDPGHSTKPINVTMVVPTGHRSVLDYLKVIATEVEIRPEVFPQQAIRKSPPPAALGNDLEKFLANSLRGTKAAQIVKVKSWTSKQTAVRVVKSGEVLNSFAVSFKQPTPMSTVLSNISSTKDMCSPLTQEGQANCERLNPIDSDGTTWELSAVKVVRGLNGYSSVGEAFDEAYKIQEQSGALRVEPMFELPTPGIESDQGIDKRSVSGDSQHDPLAAQDDLWAVKQVSAHDAWAKIRNKLRVNEGEEGKGILIAHVDTGYTEHPENWVGPNGESPIAVDKGHNYYEPGKSPLDPLLDDGVLDNPGHGTASGSVIISPSGCQLQGAERCVNGIGRGARLIPLRVHRSVSQFNMSYMTHAIQDVADNRISGNPRLISIAMGGPPTFSLWRAVKAAEKNGVLIVAAAGNYVKTVVWPARFTSAIAVAANNVRCVPWSNSSRGDAVDISAPGESVWRATLNGKHQPVNGMGKGTTFATGHTSGAATLWLAWHGQSEVFREIQKAGLLTKVFKHALQKSSWKPSTNPEGNPPGSHCDAKHWSSDYGPGILNVNALLDVPIEMPNVERALIPEGNHLPLFGSLYPEGTDPNLISRDYRMIFGKGPDGEVDLLERFETEILHQYTINDEVRNVVDKLVGGSRGVDTAQSVRDILAKQDISNKLRAELAN